MTETISVNQVIAQLETLAGHEVTVTGVMSFNFEEVCISHWPKSERGEAYKSSIWLSTGGGAFQFDI